MGNKAIGAFGEKLACDFLLKKGYKIIETNFRTRFGELDIIASFNDTIVFIEVKTRSDLQKGKPYEAVNLRKLKHLKRAIHFFLLTKGYQKYKLRLDIITVLLGGRVGENKIKQYENIETERW